MTTTMKYHMRKKERQISDRTVLDEILRNGKYATLAFCRNNEPYIATLSYGYDSSSGSLYFHCAREGLKTEFVHENPRVCATIIQDKGYIQGECAHAFRSVVIRGKIEILTEESEKKLAIDVMLEHLEERPEIMQTKLKEKPEQFREVQIWRLKIEELDGKEGR